MCTVEPAKCRLSNRRPPWWSLHLLSLWFYVWEYCICADLCASSLSYLFWPRNGQIFLFIFFSVPCRLKNGLHLLCCAVLAREWSAYASKHFSVHFVCHWIIPVWEVSFWMVKLQKGGGGGDLDWLTRVSHAYKKEFWSIILLKQGCGEGHLHWLETGHQGR